MKDIKVLGPACKTCTTTTTAAELVQSAANALGVDVRIETVTDLAAIAGYGVMSTPGIVIDGKVMHVGSLPKPDDLARWLTA